MTFLNKFFDKIYVINLFDKLKRWEKMEKQFKNRKIKVTRFITADGRCKDQSPKGCSAKINSFDIIYDKNLEYLTKSSRLFEKSAAISLSLSTLALLRNAIKHNFSFVLLCEDDIELSKNFEKNFKKIIQELVKANKMDWDMLYLGIGGCAGNKDISLSKTKKTPYLSDIAKLTEEEFYVHSKNDLRSFCYEDDKYGEVTENVVRVYRPGGTWCYAVSLEGAKKIVKRLEKQQFVHIDQFYIKNVENGKLKAYACNPPLVMHEEGMARNDSDIPWVY
jgi:GR25 family glycosyltransferase involved in LPS biosynthesis